MAQPQNRVSGSPQQPIMGAEIVAAAPPSLSLKCRWGSVADNPSAKFGLIRHLIRLITANWCQFHRSSFISLAVEMVPSSPSIWSGLVRFPNPLAIAKSETESLTRVGQVLWHRYEPKRFAIMMMIITIMFMMMWKSVVDCSYYLSTLPANSGTASSPLRF